VTPHVLPLDQAAAHVGLSVSGFKSEVKAGRLPKPRALSARRVGWLRHELEAWADARPVSEIAPPANTGGRS
jgi:predicted DNA-binding transcriptional regulator AlpA